MTMDNDSELKSILSCELTHTYTLEKQINCKLKLTFFILFFQKCNAFIHSILLKRTLFFLSKQNKKKHCIMYILIRLFTFRFLNCIRPFNVTYILMYIVNNNL